MGSATRAITLDMSLKDLVLLNVLEAPSQPQEGTKICPGDYGTYTMYELQRIHDATKRVKLHSPIFQTLTLEWEVSVQFMMLMLRLSARVRNRDDLVSISDLEMRERVREMYRDGHPAYGTPFGEQTFRAPPPNLVVISTKEPVRIPSGLHKDEDALVVFLGCHARERLRWFVYHEVDEMLLVDNERKFDPHPKLAINYTFKANGDVVTEDNSKPIGGFKR